MENPYFYNSETNTWLEGTLDESGVSTEFAEDFKDIIENMSVRQIRLFLANTLIINDEEKLSLLKSVVRTKTIDEHLGIHALLLRKRRTV